jgi:hypothetical protein
VKLARIQLVLVLAAAGAFAACGTSKSSGFNPPGPGTGGNDASAPSTTGDGGITPILTGQDGSVGQQGAIAVLPAAPVVTVVTGQPIPTQQFTATVNGQPTTQVVWSIDQGALGAIDATGLFTPSGTVGGVANIKASMGTETGSTAVTVKLQSTDLGDPGWSATPPDAGAGGYGGVGGDGPGAAPIGGQTGALNGTPTADSSVSILYPYDGTVWPQGLLPPLLQWNPGAHSFDSVYVHIVETNYEYKGYFATNTTGPFVNVPIPAAAWNAMAYSNGGEAVQVSLVFAQGANAYGPYTQTWKIAQATLQGTIYYNSYGTTLVKNSNSVDSYGNQYGAGTLAIAPGTTAPTLVAGVNSPNASGDGTGCRVCHTVAANGQSLVTQVSNSSASSYAGTVGINLANDTTGGAGTPLATSNLTFPALYKDGSMLLSSAGGVTYPGSAAGSTQLYTVPGGTAIGASGLPSGFQAALPAFSPDGAHVSFNFWAGSLTSTSGTSLAGNQTSLAMLDFDGTSAFSNPRILYTPPAGTAVTYSSFFPNAAGIVFEVELTNPTNCWGYTWSNNQAIGNTGELWWLDVASGKAHRLDALNGYGTSGAVYLPGPASGTVHTPAQDATLNYEATVNPIASGGYAWVVFTSRRMYGNVAQISPWMSDPRQYPWLDEVTDKKLWVAAVDLNGTPGTDPSHPAFYLPAQELHAGNSRGYWTVEPCRANGQSCIAGDQCCGGFCQPAGDGGLECTAQAPTCSAQYEKCTTTGDCCGAASGIQCINGVCTQLAPK